MTAYKATQSKFRHISEIKKSAETGSQTIPGFTVETTLKTEFGQNRKSTIPKNVNFRFYRRQTGKTGSWTKAPLERSDWL